MEGGKNNRNNYLPISTNIATIQSDETRTKNMINILNTLAGKRSLHNDNAIIIQPKIEENL